MQCHKHQQGLLLQRQKISKRQGYPEIDYCKLEIANWKLEIEGS
jgi:hypothetical protein